MPAKNCHDRCSDEILQTLYVADQQPAELQRGIINIQQVNIFVIKHILHSNAAVHMKFRPDIGINSVNLHR